MAQERSSKHLWVGRCGCYSDIAKPSWKPWFWCPELDFDDLRSLFTGKDYWNRSRLAILRNFLRPLFFGGDEYCRKTIVIGFPITGRIIIPLWGHSEKDCGDCPMIDLNTGGTFLDTYLETSREIDAEHKTLLNRARNIRKLRNKK